MSTNKWECIFQSADTLFFARNNSEQVVISDGATYVREYSKEHVSGCAYNGNILWLSMEDSNVLIAVDSEDHEESIPVPDYETARILKMTSGQDSVLVLEVSRAKDLSLLLFDCKTGQIVCILPICESFIDTIITGANTAFLLCEETRRVLPRYMDELPDEEVLFWAEFTWDPISKESRITRKITLYIDHNYETDWGTDFETVLYSDGLRFPLFDQYLYDWLVQESFSPDGKYVVYYCNDIHGIIIGNPEGGYVYRIFSLPKDVANPENEFYFNGKTGRLVTVTEDNCIKQYDIRCASTEAIDRLNAMYDQAYRERINLSGRRNKENIEFKNTLYQAIGSCSCVPAGSFGVTEEENI